MIMWITFKIIFYFDNFGHYRREISDSPGVYVRMTYRTGSASEIIQTEAGKRNGQIIDHET